MTDTKRPLKVFLCHASADKPKVRELYRALKRRGVQPWLDAEDLIPGQNWEMEIPKALLSSDAIIICLTPNSVDKEGYVQKEIKFALDKAMEMPEGRIFIIPARLEECDLPFSLKKFHAVDLYEKTGYTKLMQALKLRASQLERATVQLPKAGETTAEIEKIVEEKKHQEPKEEIPEIKTPKPSQDKVGGGGDVKESVIVSGSGNVINIGEQKKPEPEKPQPRKTKPPRKPNIAIIVALIGLAGTIGAALISSPSFEKWFSPVPSLTATITSTSPADATQYTRYDIPIIGYPSFGPEDAEIILVEFAEFQDPHSQRWYNETFQKLFDAYPGKIRLVYRNLPLVSIHPDSFLAAEASLCANDQGAYWQYHDLLYTGDSLESEVYLQYATSLGLNLGMFQDCLSSEKHKDFIQNDSDFAYNLGIRSSPTFFINGVVVVGNQPLDIFKQVIDKELAGEIP